MIIRYDDQPVEMSDEWSHKDFSNRTDVHFETLGDVNVYMSSFSQCESRRPFPEDMKGVTFYNCNLDNCFIPSGNTTVNCSTRTFAEQNDREDWIVDDKGNPVEPVRLKEFVRLGLSIDPTDISDAAQDIAVTVDLSPDAKDVLADITDIRAREVILDLQAQNQVLRDAAATEASASSDTGSAKGA